jgi:folate-binding protein YgfZ
MFLAHPVRRSAFRINSRRYSPPLRHFSKTCTNGLVITTDPTHASPLTTKDQTFHFAWLRSRSLIRLSGPDVSPFLQGLITANITKFELPAAAVRPIYTGFLNAQGRVLSDVFLWRCHQLEGPGDGSWLIDVDAASRGSLLAHLKKHKLRSKVKIENVSDEELKIYQGWVVEEQGIAKDQEGLNQHKVLKEKPEQPLTAPDTDTGWFLDAGVSVMDPRPNLGMRWIGSAEGTALDTLSGTSTYDPAAYGECHQVSEADYKIHRMLHGIAEGQQEIIGGNALPQESNMDFFNGIDFRKGCYLGQELTIRTHHTGVVRKRILPVQLHKEYAPIVPHAKGPTFVGDPEHPQSLNLDPSLPPPGSNISKLLSRGRSTGKWLGGIGNIGLALCRLEMMTDIRLTDEPTQYDPDQEFKISWDAQPGYEAGEVKIKAFVPPWLRDSISVSLKSRERNSTKDEESDEVD